MFNRFDSCDKFVVIVAIVMTVILLIAAGVQ